MKTFTYKIKQGKSAYLLTFEAMSIEEAIGRVRSIEGDKATIEFMIAVEGTLDDYLGEEAITRLGKKRLTAKKAAQIQKNNRRYDKRFDPAEGATRARTT